MANNDVKNYVSDVFDINNYKEKIIFLYAGVGSGKNVYFDSLADKMPILMVTSRVAKVHQTLHKYTILDDERSIERYIDSIYERGNRYDTNITIAEKEGRYECIPEELEDIRTVIPRFGTVYNQSACITYSKFSYFFYKLYDRYGKDFYDSSVYSVLWNLFKVIVFDEAHSLMMDSMYQNALFTCSSFIKVFNSKCKLKDRKLVLMTGTPESLIELRRRTHGAKTVDLRNKCRSVTPKKIEFISAKDLVKDVESEYCSGKKIMIFTGKVVNPRTLFKDTNIDLNRVALVCSDEKKLNAYKQESPMAYGLTFYVIGSIEETKRLPVNVDIVVVTNKFYEGIDVEGVDDVYIYAHDATTVKQISGRFRDGIHTVKIMVDFWEFMYTNEFELEEGKYTLAENQVSALNKKFNKLPKEERKDIVDRLLDPFCDNKPEEYAQEYIRYNVFEKRFEFYEDRKQYVLYMKSAFMKWYIKNVKGLRRGDMEPDYYKNIVQAWFPNVLVEQYKSRLYLIRERIWLAFSNGKIISKKNFDKLVKDLNAIYGDGKTHGIKKFISLICADMTITRIGRKDVYECKRTK